MPGSGGGGGGSSDDSAGPVETFVNWSTRNTDEYVSGTDVERDTVRDRAEHTDTGDWEPTAEGEHPDWREDWQEAGAGVDAEAQNAADFLTGDRFATYVKIAVAVVGVGGALYLFQPILRIIAGVIGQ